MEDPIGGWAIASDYGYTDADGYLRINSVLPNILPSPGTVLDLYLRIYYSGRGWHITTENSTATYSMAFDIMLPGRATFPEDIQPNEVPPGDRQANEIFRAAQYYYEGQSVFQKHNASSLRIIAHQNSNSIYNGVFNYSKTYSFDPLITIYNNGNPSSRVIGSTLHEIGHFIHYEDTRSAAPLHFEETAQLLAESGASFVGWFLGEAYYKSLRWSPSSAAQDITGQARQSWTKYDTKYSPLFVDLSDNYNQRTNYLSVPTDDLYGLPLALIWSALIESKNWTQCRQILQSYVNIFHPGSSYTSPELNAYIADYDYWFANN